jgi:putative Mg2+ transporter-C (MgtC) family protein
MTALALTYPSGQDWEQVGELGLAFLLSALIGLERELRQKAAGLRTLTIVGFASALFMLISKYGFFDVAAPGVSIDPSRMAAQVVSGLGFIGGGLIFVRRDSVRGLTTAAGVWVTAAIGMAAAAGLPVLACATAVAYGLVAFAFPALARRLPRLAPGTAVVQVTYLDGRGVLREALARCTGAGFAVADVSTRRLSEGGAGDPGTVTVRLELQGQGRLEPLAADLRAEAPELVVLAAHPLEQLADEGEAVRLEAELLADLALDRADRLLAPVLAASRKVPLPAAPVGVADQQHRVPEVQDAPHAARARPPQHPPPAQHDQRQAIAEAAHERRQRAHQRCCGARVARCVGRLRFRPH